METLTGLQPIIQDCVSILIIEDKLDDQLILHYLLRQQIKDVLPVGATSIQQAWTYLKNCRARQQNLPSLILLDLYMPHRDNGWKLLRKLRAHAVYQSIPVVIVSASTDSDDIERSYHWGANCYLTKPICMKDWQEVLLTLPRLARPTA
ncbi:response regulator [Larkinella harenae]